MTKEDFEEKLNALVPQPDPEITAALFAFGQELGQEEACDGVRELLNSMSFVSRHFSAVTTQSVYEIIQTSMPSTPSASCTCWGRTFRRTENPPSAGSRWRRNRAMSTPVFSSTTWMTHPPSSPAPPGFSTTWAAFSRRRPRRRAAESPLWTVS